MTSGLSVRNILDFNPIATEFGTQVGLVTMQVKT